MSHESIVALTIAAVVIGTAYCRLMGEGWRFSIGCGLLIGVAIPWAVSALVFALWQIGGDA